MALIYKKGDILEATENIICHQVNVDGIMGGGLAKQIASHYPNCENEYQKLCISFNKKYNLLRGEACLVNIDKKKFIANCFTQLPNFDTDYEALNDCFRFLLKFCKGTNMTICIPYRYGCGIANGDWNIVSQIFEDLSNEYDVDIVVYQLEEESHAK